VLLLCRSYEQECYPHAVLFGHINGTRQTATPRDTAAAAEVCRGRRRRCTTIELYCAGGVDVYAGDSAVQAGRHRFCRSEDTVDMSLVLLRPYDARLDVPRRQRASHSQSVLDPPHR